MVSPNSLVAVAMQAEGVKLSYFIDKEERDDEKVVDEKKQSQTFQGNLRHVLHSDLVEERIIINFVFFS